MDAAVWFKRIKCLVLVCIFASIGNFISTSKAGNPVTPLEAVPGLVLLLLCTLVGCISYELIDKVSPKNRPAIAYISFIAILITIYSEIWARILKTPATTVLMPTVIPLIPGGSLYYAMDAALRRDMPQSPSEKMWIHLRNRDLRS